jgi:trigger factor
MTPDGTRTFTLSMADDYRDKNVAGKPAQFEVTLHWVKERELPALDDEFAQQVGDYSDVAGLRSAIQAQIKQREEDRVREKLEEDAVARLVEISSIEFPPQLVDNQAEYMLASFKNSVERQGLQLNQYLRMLGKELDAFEQEIRAEAEARVRRTLALDAFATAEHIDGEDQTTQADADARSTRALARLVELATGIGQNGESGSKNAADQANTSDTGIQTPAADATASTSEEDPGTA